VIATLLGFLTLAVGASSVVVESRDALNTIWHVPLDRGNTGLSSIFRFVKERFYSFAMIWGVGFLHLVSLVLNAWIGAMGRFFTPVFPTPESSLTGTFLISFLVISFVFAAIYKNAPRRSLAMEGCSGWGGAAGSLVIVLLWLYTSRCDRGADETLATLWNSICPFACCSQPPRCAR
jgi:membrane protein